MFNYVTVKNLQNLSDKKYPPEQNHLLDGKTIRKKKLIVKLFFKFSLHIEFKLKLLKNAFSQKEH
jgi:hypothetical protein